MSEAKRQDAKTSATVLQGGRLVVDLVGPYVVHFTRDGVNVYAPLCMSHFQTY